MWFTTKHRQLQLTQIAFKGLDFRGWGNSCQEVQSRASTGVSSCKIPVCTQRTALWTNPTHQRVEDLLPHRTSAPKGLTTVSSAGAQLWLGAVVKHCLGLSTVSKEGTAALLNQSWRSRPSSSTSFNWQLPLEGLLQDNSWAFSSRHFTPKAASPTARWMMWHQQSPFSLQCTPKHPKKAWSPQALPALLMPQPPHISHLLLEELQSVWGTGHALFQAIWYQHTHTQTQWQLWPRVTQTETNLGDGRISTQHLPEFCGNSMCFMCSWNLLSLRFKIATKNKFPAFWNFQQRKNCSPGVICDLLLHSQVLWSWEAGELGACSPDGRW